MSLAGLLGSTLAALADPPAPAPATQPAAATQTSDSTNDPNAIICRTMDAQTGSRIGGRRICQTQREWDDWRKQNEETVKQFQAMGENQSANPAGGGGH